MSPAFIKGAAKCFPSADITFDKFHVMKIVNDAVDKVRRQEQKDQPDLKNTRYIFLKNPKNLTDKQVATLEQIKLKDLNLKTMRAYQIRLNFQEFRNQPLEQAEGFLKKLVLLGNPQPDRTNQRGRLYHKCHWNGVMNWFKSRINNGILEGINSMIQAAKARARGYRTIDYMITMIYLLNGKLKFNLPT